MGLEVNTVGLFLKMRREGIRLGEVLTLGRQDNHLSRAEYVRLCKAVGKGPRQSMPERADEILSMLGASSVEAVDASNYEGASIVHDMNTPIPGEFREKYDLVFDGGTLEHVFNFPVALRSCMEMTRLGGRMVVTTMANNYCGHGFYQFSPELFWRVFSEANGFLLEEMYLCAGDGNAYAVADPHLVHGRVELCNDRPVLLLVRARRTGLLTPFQMWPQQSDYASSWKTYALPTAMKPRPNEAWWMNAPLVIKLRQWRASILVEFKRLKTVRGRRLSNRVLYTPTDLTF